jgi:hypothetical protein
MPHSKKILLVEGESDKGFFEGICKKIILIHPYKLPHQKNWVVRIIQKKVF